MSTGSLPSGDLFALTAALVDIPSVSFEERALVDLLESDLRACPHLSVERIGDNLVARTELGRSRRLVLAGHTDTVPPNGNDRARIEGDTLFGVGSTDMKGGVATIVELARTIAEPAVDVTYVLYAREEVGAVHNGLREIEAERPDLLVGDVALLGEPTLGAIEAGCQGTLRARVTLAGERAHTARPWMGRNAIHRLGELLTIVEAYDPRLPVVEGCEYREALQAVEVSGGVAGNVVPDEASVLINHRFAPDRSGDQAVDHVRSVVEPILQDGDTFEIVDLSLGARPGLGDPLIAALIKRSDLDVRAKLGWTDVAFFAERGVPASNFGPGDPTIAHSADERLERRWLLDTHDALRELLCSGA